jgi:hypothetical protein
MPKRYRLVAKGELGARYTTAFDGMVLSPHDGVTEIAGPVADSSHLHTVLERIAALGLTLESLRRLDDEDSRHTCGGDA